MDINIPRECEMSSYEMSYRWVQSILSYSLITVCSLTVTFLFIYIAAVVAVDVVFVQ